MLLSDLASFRAGNVEPHTETIPVFDFSESIAEVGLRKCGL